ncbi:exonuclease [Candidatus Saccharibacteria bacterium]|nr:MAG: exonuclease [Candidatus Saccharibacteria bacterium]
MKDRKKGKSLVGFPSSFTVLDIETTGLDTTFDSIIELSAIKVKDGSVIDTFSTLVNPERPLDGFITELTGITDDLLQNAPTIETALGSFMEFLGSDVVVGHNVNFDINFIYDEYRRIASSDFTNDFVDTLRLARFLLTDLDHHRLSDLVEYFGLWLGVKHRGLSDANATLGVLSALYDRAVEQYGDIVSFETAFMSRRYTHKAGVKASDITSTNTNFDTTHPLFDKNCVFTGKLAKMPRKEAFQLVVDFGGRVEDSITKKTNYLIVGSLEYSHTIEKGKSKKIKKAERMILNDEDIQILSENAFYDILGI